MPAEVRTVHVVAKTHLDLGFTDLAAEVADRYVDEHVPRAISVAAELRARRPQPGAPAPQLVWTTGSWILHHALHHGRPEQRAAVAEAVERGVLRWHALPVTTHTELMDADLVRAGLAVSAELDERFGQRTTAAKLTDVPGHTRGLVPILATAGVTFLHIGVNPAWPVPDVPPTFRWRDPTGHEVVVAYQAGGYGGVVAVPGCPDVLAFLHSGDNLGPPSVDDVLAGHAELAAQHPGAEVRASTLEAFALALGASGAVGDLPVVTAEIGDPWIFGAGSDPVKVAAFREVLRARRHLPPGDARAAVDRHLLLAAEHTWGLDQKVWLPDDVRWDRAGLAALRATPEAVRFEGSWAEQRAYVDRAADALATADANPTAAGPDAALPAGAAAVGRVDRVAAAVPRWPMGPDGVPSGGFTPVEAGRPVTGAGWRVAVDPATGALAEATRTGSGRALADPDHLLGAFSYQSFDERDYERFFAGLTPSAEDEGWARWDNTKPGIDAAGARSGRWHPVPTGCWHASQQGGAWHTLLVRGACTGEASEALGAPAEVWSRWTWSTASDELELDLWWEDKPANRLPEATWCSFTPLVAEPERWTIDKLGQAVSPLDVVRRGGRALHAVGAGMAYDGPDGRLAIRTVDAPLVAPGRPGLLDADPPVPDLAGGFHVLLHDNCWGTNFPMWVEGPARFRFAISVGEVSPPRS